MTDYRRLAEAANRIDDTVKRLLAEREEMQSAIEALQEENALLEGTLESRGRNIAEMQAENERLELSLENACRKSEALQAKLDAMGKGEPVVPAAWTNLLAYVLQDDMHNRLTPRVIDIAYTAFTLAKQPNNEDGGASDWFNDTKPHITKLIAKLHKDLTDELDAAPKALAPEQAEAAWRAGWSACRDAEYVGQEAEDEAWGMSETCASADWENASPKALAPSREVIGRYMADKGFYLSKEALDGLMLKLEGIGGTP